MYKFLRSLMPVEFTFTIHLLVLYIIIFRLKAVAQKTKNKHLRGIIYVIGVVIVPVGYVLDVLYNWTVGTRVFGTRPRRVIETFTTRLNRALTFYSIDSYPFEMAIGICSLLNQYDPDHCKLSRINQWSNKA